MFSDNDVQRPAKTSRMRGGGVSIDCSHMLHLKRLGEAEDYPGLGSLKIWKPFGLLYSGKIDFDLKFVVNDDFEVVAYDPS